MVSNILFQLMADRQTPLSLIQTRLSVLVFDSILMKTFVVEGVVLKRRNVGEADRILTIFTRTHGKLTVKAVGVRKIASKRSSHIELLNRVSIGLYKGKGMPVVTEATAIESFPQIKEDLTKIGFAYHLCELVDGLCPEGQENSTVFAL